MNLTCAECKSWAHEVWEKIEKKVGVVSERNVGKIPYTTVNGAFDDKLVTGPSWWTNGFWSGILWIMYERTGDKKYKEYAEIIENKMDKVLYDSADVHHDVGFMWLHISVANYRLNGNAESKRRGLIAANYLASRFNPLGGYIIAWNGAEKQGWSIIDTMMNLPILYWASEETGYNRYKEIAMLHADKTLNNVIRPDGSVIHIIEYDINNGDALGSFFGQGYEVGSSWTRGQAWAIYGFALSYLHTGNVRYLDAAKKVAHYFMAALSDDNVPNIDFRSPAQPIYKDTTAGAIAACGMLTIAESVKDFEKDMYIRGALRILKALEKEYCNFDDNHDALLSKGSEAYHDPAKKHIDIIYGDYFFIEAIARLNGMSLNLW